MGNTLLFVAMLRSPEQMELMSCKSPAMSLNWIVDERLGGKLGLRYGVKKGVMCKSVYRGGGLQGN